MTNKRRLRIAGFMIAALAVAPSIADPAKLHVQFDTLGSHVATRVLKHDVPFFPRAADSGGRQGFVRIINNSSRDGGVSIVAFDDSGRDAAPVTLTLAANEAVHFNSEDLEQGNPGKGLQGSTGSPRRGDWRLELTTELDIDVFSFVRTRQDGFLTSMHDVVAPVGGSHPIGVFNPGSNTDQLSLLRLINPGATETEVRISGSDDRGAASGIVRIELPPGSAQTVRANELESGTAGFRGSLGNGTGKWRLDVESDTPVVVMNLMSTPTGHITNLSSTPGGGTEVVETDEDDHGSTFATATVVMVPSTTDGDLEEIGDRDFFRIAVNETVRLVVTTSGSTDTAGSLYDADETLVEMDDDGGEGVNFRLAAEVQPGTYYVEVRGYNDNRTGAYTLRVSEDDGEEVVGALSVTVTGPDSAEIRWVWDVRPNQAYAFDKSVRFRLTDGRSSDWRTECDVWTTPSNLSGPNELWSRLTNIVIYGAPPEPGTAIQARVRYRRGGACSGAPTEWSPVGEDTF